MRGEGSRVQTGGGRVEHHCEGGGGKSDLLSTFPGVKAASDVELQPICFFFIPKKTGGNLTCGPPSMGVERGRVTSVSAWAVSCFPIGDV